MNRDTPRLLAVGSGGNLFPELLSACHEIRNLEDYDWTHLAGISAGALVCALVSMVPYGDLDTFNRDFERARLKFTDTTTSPFQPWIPLGQFASALFAVLFHKESVFKNNMSQFVDQEFCRAKYLSSGRVLSVGIFDTVLQAYRTVCSENCNPTTMQHAIVASTAVPVACPSQTVQGNKCRDGGIAHAIPVVEIARFIDDHRKRGKKVHVDLLISDSIQWPPSEKQTAVDVTDSLLGVCVSMAWLNLERDLEFLVRQYLSDSDDEAQIVLHLLRTGKKCNFKRPFGTLRVVAPIDLTPRDRRRRSNFDVVDSDKKRDQLVARGAKAAWRACNKRPVDLDKLNTIKASM